MPSHDHLVFYNVYATHGLKLNAHQATNLWFTSLSRFVKFKLPHVIEEGLHVMGFVCF